MGSYLKLNARIGTPNAGLPTLSVGLGAVFWNERVGLAVGKRTLGSIVYSFVGVGSGTRFKYPKSVADYLLIAFYVVLYERGTTLCDGDGPFNDHDHRCSCVCNRPAAFPARALVGHPFSFSAVVHSYADDCSGSEPFALYICNANRVN